MPNARFLMYATLLLFIACKYEKADSQSLSNEYTGKELGNLNARLAKGWNTWNTRSVMSHVLLPEGFALNLKLKDQSGKVLEETLIGKDHYDSKERVTAGPHAYDGSYTEIEVEWHNIQLRVQSATLNNELYVLVTPLQTAAGDSLIIAAKMLWNKNGAIKIAGNTIVGQTEQASIRVFVNGKTTTTNSDIKTPLNKKIAISSGTSKPLAIVENAIKKAREAFEAGRLKFDRSETYNAMQTVLAWTTIYDPNNNRVINPVSRTFSNDWVLFTWDTYFAAYMLALDNKDLAYANAIAMTKDITAKGFIPNVSQPGHKSEDRSEPQVGAIVAREIYKKIPREMVFTRSVQ